MKRKVFVASDLHFGHKRVVKFRPQYATVEEHDEDIVRRWNETVRPDDKVYVLGDAAWTKKDLKTVARLNGTKVLIAGNHDILRTSDYLTVFRNVRGFMFKDEYGVFLSHSPVHKVGRRGYKNIHGHLHKKLVRNMFGLKDKNYINVCLEHTDYRPVEIKELLK